MALQVQNLRFRDFRNYPEFSLEDIGRMTVLVGPNAVGKTNIVEGIQLLTALESFRNPATDQLVRWGCCEASVAAQLGDGERQLDMRLVMDERGRRYLLNGKQRPRQELQGQLPAVLFTPDDLQLVKGGPERRRAALDALGVQVSRNYLSVKRDYEKLLRQKNRLLKEDVTPAYLASVNEVLAKIGSQLLCYRLRIVRELRRVLPPRHAETTGTSDEVQFAYTPSIDCPPASVPDECVPSITPAATVMRDGGISPTGPAQQERCSIGIADELLEAYLADRSLAERDFHATLMHRAPEEAARRTSLVGPHRDKPAFLLNGRAAADYASQGQQRSIAIAYKLCELQIIEALTHQKPILLLDDVMSELDAARRATLTRYVHDAVQTFITTTNLEYFTPDLLAQAKVVTLPTPSS